MDNQIEKYFLTAITMPEVDYLVCGTCQQDFPLHDIVRFMQHKKFDCDDTRPAKRVEGKLVYTG